MLRAIDRRTHNQFALEAGLHGIKIPMRYNRELSLQKSEAEDTEFDKMAVERAMIEAQSRVRSRYVRTHN